MRKAFTLFEVLVVLTLIGVLATILLPRLNLRKPNVQWKTVVCEINNLLLFARQEAITNHKNHRLVFRSDSVFVEDESINKSKTSELVYNPVSSLYAATRYDLPDAIKINAVYFNKKDLFQSKETQHQGHCYIVPDGLIQPVIIWLTRMENGEASKVTIKTQSFLGDCIYLDGHKTE